MWIRSQDKRELIDITGKRLNVWNGQNGWSIYVDPMTSIDDVSVSLGSYLKVEAAVDVLDQIQNQIEDYSSGEHPEWQEVVFEMPKESE